MDTQLWNLFRETGDPLGYLLFKAEHVQTPEKKESEKTEKLRGEPAALSL